jgi:hypothetical protein
MRIFVAVALMCIASAAGAQPSPESAPIKVVTTLPIPSEHNVVFFREHAEPLVWSPTIKVDGVKIVAIPNKSYTSARLAPGHHHLTLAWPLISSQRGGSMEIDVKGEDVVQYVEVLGISRYDGFYFTVGSGLAEAKPDLAEPQIASCCKYKPAK